MPSFPPALRGLFQIRRRDCSLAAVFVPCRCLPVSLAGSSALLAPNLVDGEEKSARLLLKAADVLDSRPLLATFGHSQSDNISDFRSSQVENRFVVKMRGSDGKNFD
jgi:hypothetical protein